MRSMMKSMLLSLMCVLLITTGAFANMRFDGGYQTTGVVDSESKFHVVDNWAASWGSPPTRRLPGSSASAGEVCSIQAILPDAGPGTPYVVTLDQDFVDTTSTFVLNVRHNQSAVANVLNISADLNSVSTFNVGWAVNASGIINQTAGDVAVGVLRVGSGAASTEDWPSAYALSGGTLTMTAGSYIGLDGTFEQTAGTFNPQGSLTILSGGVMEISGGTMEHASRLSGAGTVRIIGDDATINLHQVSGSFTGTFEFDFDETGVSGIDNDSWGDLSASNFVVDGDFTSAGGDFVLYTGLYPADANGIVLTAALGSNYVVNNLGTQGVDWTWNETTANPHTITLTILSDKATMPSPADGVTVYGDGDAPVLSWRAGQTAVAHNVYFGNPLVFKERVTGTSYDPAVTLAEVTYSWRIDAVDAGEVVYPGDVWSFTIVRGAASNLSPADEATDVAADVTLTWTAGTGALNHDVYLGKEGEALELVAENITVAEYTPSLTKSLIKGMTYNWQIVEDDGANTYESPVQSFTVTPAESSCHWTNGDAGSNLWTREANWNGGVPGVGSLPYIDGIGPCVIDDTVDAYATGGWLRIGDPNDSTLEMTGGNLDVQRIALGNSGPGVINMSGGTMDVAMEIRIGDGSNAMFNMDGGTVNAGSIILNPPYTLNIDGGTLIIKGNATATINAGVASGYVIANDGLGTVSVTYDGGANKTTVTASYAPTVNAGIDQDISSLSTSVTATAWDPLDLSMTHEWTSSDAGVTFGTPTALTTTVTLPAYASVPYELTLTATNTTLLEGSDSVSVLANDPGNATNPVPADDATGVAVAPILSWTAGPGSISSDVWFGTDAEAMELVSDNQTGATYAPGTLIKGQTYYWAVDEYDGAITHYGPTWSFTVVALGGTTNWTGAASDLWNVEANWDNGVPGIDTTADIHVNGPALIDSSVEAVATGTVWSRWGITDPNEGVDPTVLDMTGGSLTLYRWALGNGGPAIVNISDGTVSILEQMVVGDGFDTTLNIDGGTVNIVNYINSRSTATTNVINLNSGLLTASNMILNDSPDPSYLGTTLDISTGTLILDGDDTAVVKGYIDAGRIIAHGDTGTVIVDYDAGANETTVTACTSVFNADMTYDCAVNLDDFAVLAQGWLLDFQLLDLQTLAEEWLLDGL